MSDQWLSIRLDDLGAVRVQGADAAGFLQGQLSNDIGRLASGHSQLSGYHTPQGRVIALLRLIWLGGDDILAILPRELAPVVTARLSRFVLRAKVKIRDESEDWRIAGLVGVWTSNDPQLRGITQSSSLSLATEPDGQTTFGSAIFVRVGSAAGSLEMGGAPRWLVISSATASADDSPGMPTVTVADRELWRRLDIESGQPQVFASTSEQFVAQMLNLDALGAIAFDKGCYTGQEIIARAHYRGRVKRRLQRFRTRAALHVAAGDTGHLADGRPLQIVDAVRIENGRCEFLAVAPVASGDAEPEIHAAREALASIDAESLALPYTLPE